MKAILISIKPEWVAKILNGEKTIEIRKTAPKSEDLPIDVYIYCTEPKAKNVLSLFVKEVRKIVGRVCEFIKRKNVDKQGMRWSICNGKVVAKFTLKKTEQFLIEPFGEGSEWEDELLAKACLSLTELDKYLDGEFGYEWHISNLEVLEEPIDLRKFWKKGAKDFYKKIRENKNLSDYAADLITKERFEVRRPPQSWQYVEVAG